MRQVKLKSEKSVLKSFSEGNGKRLNFGNFLRRAKRYTYVSFEEKMRKDNLKVKTSKEIDVEKSEFDDNVAYKIAKERLDSYFSKKNIKSSKDIDNETKNKKSSVKNEKKWRKTIKNSEIVDNILSNDSVILPNDDGFSNKSVPLHFMYNELNECVNETISCNNYKKSRIFRKIDFDLIPNSEARDLAYSLFKDSDVYICKNPMPVLYYHSKSIALSDSSPRGNGKMDLILSVDTEFQRVSGLNKNESLSYQVTCASSDGALFQLIIVTKNGYRISSAGLIDFCSYLSNGKYKGFDQSVMMIGHYFSAEWSMFSDRTELSKYLMDIRKCSVTANPGGYFFKTRRKTGNYRNFRVVISDSFLASPAKFSSLKSWGDAYQYPKIKLDDGVIENMKLFLKDNKALFFQYAIRDTEIPLLILSKYYGICESFGFKSAKTLGSSAVNYFETVAGGKRNLFENYSGKIKTKETKVYVDSRSRELGDVMASHSFHGGFNNVNFHGEIYADKSKGERLIDCDLKSAYLLQMAQIPFIDFSKSPRIFVDEYCSQSTMQSKLKYHYGKLNQPITVLCEFDCVDGTPFYDNPCLPVRSDTGLQYVRSGESYCTAPEVMLAIEMGADVKILRMEMWHINNEMASSVKEKMISDGDKSEYVTQKIGMYSEILSVFVKNRFKFEKIMNESDGAKKITAAINSAYMKEFGNSLYGKVAQAVVDRTVSGFSPFADSDTKMLTPSKISLPIAASMITGGIRACVHSMNWEFRKHGYEVISSTTDGSLVKGLDIDNDRLHEILKGSFCSKSLRKGQQYLGTEGERIYEIKHTGNRAIVRRTRAYTLYDDDIPVMIAKGGIKIDGSDSDIARVLEQFDKENFVVKHTEKRLVNARDIAWYRENDLITIDVSKRTHNDFDFKRRLLSNGYTVAWDNIEDYRNAKSMVDLCHASGHRADFTHMEMRLSGLMVNRDFTKTFNYVIRNFCAFEFYGWEFFELSKAKVFDISKSSVSQIRTKLLKSLDSEHLDPNLGDSDVSKKLYDIMPKLPRTNIIVNELNVLIDTISEIYDINNEKRQEMIMAVTYDVDPDEVNKKDSYRLPELQGKWILSTDKDGRLKRERRRSRIMIQKKVGTMDGHEHARKSILMRKQYEENKLLTKEWIKEKEMSIKEKMSILKEAYFYACKSLSIEINGDILTKVINKRVKKSFDRLVSLYLKQKGIVFV